MRTTLDTLAPFVSKWDSLVLAQVMREVLRAADPEHPERVTQRAYNEARVAQGFAHTPRADKLARRYGLDWRRLVPIVVADADAARTIARAAHATEREVLTHAEAVTSLRRAARHLGTDALSPPEYEAARQALNGLVTRRHLHGRAAEPLPSLAVIRDKFSFPALAADAGLSVTPRDGQRLMARATALRLFVEHCGFLPRQLDLAWFATHHRIQLVDKEHERHSAAVATARAEARALGRWFPSASPARVPDEWQRNAKAGSDALARARAAFPAARKAGYTVAEVRAAIRQAFDLLPPGTKLTQERYRLLSVEHRLPSPSVIHRLGKRQGTSFGGLVCEVAAERAEALRSAQRARTHA